jgi:hypothetical protein
MDDAMKIELHGRDCSCRGGSWVFFGENSGSPCPGSRHEPGQVMILTMAEWRSLGKPASVEEYAEASARAQAGERREFKRFEVSMPLRLSRMPSWRSEEPQAEETLAEVIARGGALVRSRMAIDKGELLTVEIGPDYSTRAEVMYVSSGTMAGGDGIQRLGLRFLDALMPDELIPPDAKPLP